MRETMPLKKRPCPRPTVTGSPRRRSNGTATAFAATRSSVQRKSCESDSRPLKSTSVSASGPRGVVSASCLGGGTGSPAPILSAVGARRNGPVEDGPEAVDRGACQTETGDAACVERREQHAGAGGLRPAGREHEV